MATDRRGFLRLTASATALLLPLRTAAARDPGAETALDVHRATSHTRAGVIGATVRAGLQAELPPFKEYRGLAREALTMPSWAEAPGRALFAIAQSSRPARAFAPEPISRHDLARILFLANGVTQTRDGLALRAAPSAGALYAGELYAVVERVAGLAAGIYYYDVRAHALVPLRRGPSIAEVARAVAHPDASRAAAAVLVTNVFARYRARYTNRAYRYALIDAGHIGENLRLATGELGLGEAAPADFEDGRLEALLGVDGREESVCAVHLVGGTAEPAADPSNARPARALVERQIAAPAEVARWGGLSDAERYHAATQLVWADRGGPQPTDPPEIATAPEKETEGISSMPVHVAIRTRRSTRRFEASELRRDDLLAILALARRSPALHRSAGLHLHVVVHRVADTPAGVYRYQPASHRLELRRAGELSSALVRATLGQKQTGEAAVAIVCTARLDGSRARSYRDQLLDAGATAQRVYLGAEALGLTARNLAAFYDDELDALLGRDGEREVAVHLTAVGAGD